MKQTSSFLLRSLCAAAFLLGTNQAAIAQETTAGTIESVGLYDQTNPKSFGNGVYQGTQRSELIYFFNKIKNGNTIIDNAYNNFLLTEADANVIENDIESSADQNLTSLRMHALIDRGLANKAAEIYSKFETVGDYESIAQQGVISLLMSGQKGLACLEVKTLYPNFNQIDFWKNLNLYCSSSLNADEIKNRLSETESSVLTAILTQPEYTIEYQPEIFSGISTIDIAILTAEKRITLPANLTYGQIPPADIQSLIQIDTTPEIHASILVRALDVGSIQPDSIETFLKKHIPEGDAKNDIERLAKLYDETKSSWLGVKRDERIESVFSITKEYGDALLIPFVPVVSKMEPDDDLSPENTLRILKVMIDYNLQIPEDWKKQTLKRASDNPTFGTHLLTLSVITEDDESTEEKLNSVLVPFFKTNRAAIPLKNIIENVDIIHKYGDKFRYVYENDFDSAWNKSYIMPPALLLDALEHWSENQNTAMTLLATAYILGHIDAKQLHEQTLGDIVIALNKTGLKSLSQRILARAILEIGN